MNGDRFFLQRHFLSVNLGTGSGIWALSLVHLHIRRISGAFGCRGVLHSRAGGRGGSVQGAEENHIELSL